MIDGAPEVVLDAVNPHENLVEMPLPLSVLAHVGRALRSDFADEEWAKPIDPESHAFMADIDPAFMTQVFGITK